MSPGKCLDRIIRMKVVEREYRVAVALRDHMVEALKKDPSILTNQGLNRSDFDRLRVNLTSTFLIRLFAEFETGLRDFWKNGLGRRSNAPVRDLIDSVSSNRKIEDIDRANTHVVRKYRNKIIHEQDLEAEVVELQEARRFLCIFFGKLPENW